MTQAYIGHLQSVAHGGTLGEIVAAVLPCYWIYGEVGQALVRPARASRKSFVNGSRFTPQRNFGNRCVSKFRTNG